MQIHEGFVCPIRWCRILWPLHSADGLSFWMINLIWSEWTNTKWFYFGFIDREKQVIHSPHSNRRNLFSGGVCVMGLVDVLIFASAILLSYQMPFKLYQFCAVRRLMSMFFPKKHLKHQPLLCRTKLHLDTLLTLCQAVVLADVDMPPKDGESSS